jgi:hypothetical protein
MLMIDAIINPQVMLNLCDDGMEIAHLLILFKSPKNAMKDRWTKGEDSVQNKCMKGSANKMAVVSFMLKLGFIRH